MSSKNRRILRSVDEKIFGKLVAAARTLRPRTLAQLAKEVGMHHTTLARIEAGDRTLPYDKFANVQHHLERLGFEFIEGTRELALRYAPGFAENFERDAGICTDNTMPAGTRAVHPRPSGSVDGLLELLKLADVRVEGEPALRQILEVSHDWCAMLVKLAENGRPEGIRFLSPADAGPGFFRDLVDELMYFPFPDHNARRTFVANIRRESSNSASPDKAGPALKGTCKSVPYEPESDTMPTEKLK